MRWPALEDCLLILGVLLIAGGLAMVFLPAAPIFVGAFLVLVALRLAAMKAERTIE